MTDVVECQLKLAFVQRELEVCTAGATIRGNFTYF